MYNSRFIVCYQKGCVVIIFRALYSLRSSGAAHQAMLAHNLRGLGYKLTCSDPDVWIKLITKPDEIGYCAFF